MRKDEITLPQRLAEAGYQTGIFGKWHLGDNYPLRAMDRGFTESLTHGGGGVGQTPDVWGNDYFDDTYLHNGVPEKQEGYCTDVFFRAATTFIERNRDRPFFAYIATNAPHSPYLVPDDAAKPYRDAGIPSPRAEFCGMIANIDENVGRLLARLDEWKLRDDTIVVFMTDNGSAAGVDRAGGNNAGMRGMKGSEYDGGHRVPCFVRYTARCPGGRDIPQLAAHIDILPTLLGLCGLSLPDRFPLDGRSLVPLLLYDASAQNWPERTLIVHSQRIEHPERWRQSAVMTERWRLINGRELFDRSADPGQANNVAEREPGVVAELRRAYDGWWNSISTRFDEFVSIELGTEAAPRSTLSCHDWHSDQVPFDHSLVKKDPEANGFWAVEFVRGGTYRVTLRSRPAGVPHRLPAGTARLRIGSMDFSKPIVADPDHVEFMVDCAAGPALLQTWLDDTTGPSRGAFFVDVERVGDQRN